MLRKIFLPACAALLVALATSSAAHAWGCYHYSYHTGYGAYGGYHYGGYSGYHYGGYGGGYHYGSYDRYGGAAGYHYGGYHYGGYGGDTGGYHYGYTRAW